MCRALFGYTKVVFTTLCHIQELWSWVLREELELFQLFTNKELFYLELWSQSSIVCTILQTMLLVAKQVTNLAKFNIFFYKHLEHQQYFLQIFANFVTLFRKMLQLRRYVLIARTYTTLCKPCHNIGIFCASFWGP